MKKIATIFLLAAIVAGCATINPEAELERAINLPKQHFADTVTTLDDPLDTVATLTTANGFQERRGLAGIVSDDNFLRAFVDKKTGKTRFQVYQVIYYSGQWRYYDSANFESSSGMQSTPVTVISRDVTGCPSRYFGCNFVEHVGFDVDEALLRRIAELYKPGMRNVWKFKFQSRAGVDYSTGLLPAEVAGLLERVDVYLQINGLAAKH